jgi:hypothetical protein
MYLNIFDVFQGAKVRELFGAVTFPSPTMKQSTMVRTLLLIYSVHFVEERPQVKKEITYSLMISSKGPVLVLVFFNESR